MKAQGGFVCGRRFAWVVLIAGCVGPATALGQTLTLADHSAGQQTDAFPNSGSATNAELFAFQLTPSAGTITVTQIVFTLSNVITLTDGDWAGVEIVVDANADGNIGGGESTTVGGAGTVNTGALTITFSTSFDVSALTRYILRADFAALVGGDQVTMALTSGNITSAATEAGSSTSTTHTEADLAATRFGFWKLNDGSGATVIDSSGNANNGSLMPDAPTGPQWSTLGPFGGSLNFDGSDDYVQVPTSAAIGSDLGSVSLWVRTSTNFTANAHVFYGSSVGTGNGAGAENELHVNFTSGETIRLFIEGGASDVSIISAGSHADGFWHHVAATWDINGNATLYVDGTQEGSVVHNATNFAFSSVHRIGRPGAASNYYTGYVDDVHVYDRLLNTEEVSILSRGSGISAHWKLDNGAGTTATDSAGGFDGTLTNGPSWISGRLCSGLDFDGVDDYVTMGDVLDLTAAENVTFSGWFNRDTFTTDDVLLAKRNAITGTTAGFIINLNAANDKLLFTAADGTDVFTLESTSVFTATGWNHFAVIWDDASAANCEIYINGADDNAAQTGVLANVGNMSNALALRIGAESDGGNPLDGKIDDVRYFERTLTATEIRALAAVYQVVDLGSVTNQRSIGAAINRVEQVVGFDEHTTTGNATAWLSRFCAFTSLGTLAGGTVAEARGINDAGKVVGWSDNAAGRRKAYRWVSGVGMTDLGTLTGRTDSEAFAINSSDEIVGTALNFAVPPTGHLAFLYLPVAAYSLSMGMNSLGTLGGDVSVARDVNDSGQVVGGAETSGDYIRPFLWLPSAAYSLPAGMNDLGTLGGENGILTHRAESINNSGQVVGLSYTAGGAVRAFLWLPSAAYGLSAGMNNLGVLTGGTKSWAAGINAFGKVVGTSEVTGATYHAFLWESGTMTDLNNLISSDSGWTLIRATDVNADGEIVGYGTNQKGQTRACLLTQTCSTSSTQTLSAALEPPLATGIALTGKEGTFQEALVDETGQVFAEAHIIHAEPDDLFEFSVEAADSSSLDLPMLNPNTDGGALEESALARVLRVESTASAGEFLMTIALILTKEEMTGDGLDASELELFVLDSHDGSATRAWVPAGRSMGRAAPTGKLGDSGFRVNADDSVEFWAVRDDAGVFAVGIQQSQEEESNRPSDHGVTRLCGLGIFPWGMAVWLTLMAARSKNRIVGI